MSQAKRTKSKSKILPSLKPLNQQKMTKIKSMRTQRLSGKKKGEQTCRAWTLWREARRRVKRTRRVRDWICIMFTHRLRLEISRRPRSITPSLNRRRQRRLLTSKSSWLKHIIRQRTQRSQSKTLMTCFRQWTIRWGTLNTWLWVRLTENHQNMTWNIMRIKGRPS